MNVAMLTSEAVPFAKTGGLADVCGALPKALAAQGVETTVVLPLYRACRGASPPPCPTGKRVRVTLGGAAQEVPVWESRQSPRLRFLFLESDGCFDRDGLYGEKGNDYPDNLDRFHLLARGGLAALQALSIAPDVVHAHDWQAALAPTFLRHDRDGRRPATVLTIHNLAFQGLFPAETFPTLGLPRHLFQMQGLEFWGKVNWLKGAILFSDQVSTVSPSYAREIQTSEFGCGLEGVLRDRSQALHGILNGIDVDDWNPASDAHLPSRYSAADPRGKALCKAALQRSMGLPEEAARPLGAFVGRLTEQKGIDLLLDALEPLMEAGLSLAVLGTGEPAFEARLVASSKRYPRRLSVRVGFDNALAHLMEAGADLFLMPSRFEPCGLNQMISLRYGTLPVVRATGGLEDTIRDADHDSGGNGFKFAEPSGAALVEAVQRALRTLAEPGRIGKLRRRGMEGDYSWGGSARKYLELYTGALEARDRG